MSDSHEPESLPPANTEEESSAIKPFLEHLEDLRWMLIKMLVTVTVVLAPLFL